MGPQSKTRAPRRGNSNMLERATRLCRMSPTMVMVKPERVSEAVTWVRAQMELEPAVQSARDVLKLCYARRKLKQMLFESAERDAAVVSRELTRRTDVKNPGYRRADRGAP